jgi:PAS domain-containing protein
LRDTGRGIDPELMPTIFDMFKQAEPAARACRPGWASAWRSCGQLVELHGGAHRGRVRPDATRARCFRVSLALAVSDMPDEDMEAAQPRAWLCRPAACWWSTTDQASVETLRRLLETEGMQVLQACERRTGAAPRAQKNGRRRPHRHRHAADGRHQLLAALRREQRANGVPVIAGDGPGCDGRCRTRARFGLHGAPCQAGVDQSPPRGPGRCVLPAGRPTDSSSQSMGAELLELALAAGAMATWEIDFETRAMSGSPQMRELMGVNDAHQLASVGSFEQCLYPDDLPLFREAMAAAAHGKELCCELRLRHSDGRIARVLDVRPG